MHAIRVTKRRMQKFAIRNYANEVLGFVSAQIRLTNPLQRRLSILVDLANVSDFIVLQDAAKQQNIIGASDKVGTEITNVSPWKQEMSSIHNVRAHWQIDIGRNRSSNLIARK